MSGERGQPQCHQAPIGWKCGRDETTCAAGPTRAGSCRGVECEPKIQEVGGEKKFTCAARSDVKKKCKGPTPDGKCGTTIDVCSPVRNTYQRPNYPWVCGYSDEGNPCLLGPGPFGGCARHECAPRKETKDGQKVYVCTRPQLYGGACKEGPSRSGRCGRAIVPCAPRLSLRGRRGIFGIAVFLLAATILFLAFGSNWRGNYINPGRLSSEHSSEGFFVAMATNKAFFGDFHSNAPSASCRGCHAHAEAGVGGMVAGFFNAHPGPLDIKQMMSANPRAMEGIEERCQKCHRDHAIHQVNIPQKESSCFGCHQEHKGPEAMAFANWKTCVACHGDTNRLTQFAAVGANMPAHDFAHPLPPGLRSFGKITRPATGYTATVTEFATNAHPEFQIVREGLREEGSFLFPHDVHQDKRVMGRKMECKECHKPDTAGLYFQRITFEANCRECHLIQFDPFNPDLVIPHGNPAFVRTFLGNLQKEYSDLARRKGRVTQSQVDAFVQEQDQALRSANINFARLEEQIIYGKKARSPVDQTSTLPGTGRSGLNGCAYCHTVQPPSGTQLPRIEAPNFPDRWMLHARFSHARHSHMQCADCHRQAETSSSRTDVMMPQVAQCVDCHKKGGVASNSCTTCHTYHRHGTSHPMTQTDPPARTAATEMLLRKLVAETSPAR